MDLLIFAKEILYSLSHILGQCWKPTIHSNHQIKVAAYKKKNDRDLGNFTNRLRSGLISFQRYLLSAVWNDIATLMMFRRIWGNWKTLLNTHLVGFLDNNVIEYNPRNFSKYTQKLLSSHLKVGKLPYHSKNTSNFDHNCWAAKTQVIWLKTWSRRS